MKISDYTTGYLRFCRVEKRNCQNTVNKYEEVLRKIISIVGDLFVTEINQHIVLKLKDVLIGQELSDDRQSLVVSVLKNYMKYLTEFLEISDLYDYEKIKIPRVKSRPVTALLFDEIERFIEMLPERTLIDKRFKALIVFLVATGARISEILGLPRDIDINAKEAVVRGKGNHSRTIHWDARSVYYLKLYQDARPKWDKSLYLFGTVNKGYSGKWGNGDINRKFKFWSKRFGKNLYCHLFRKSFCSNFLREGMPLAAVSKLMGHYGNEAMRTTLNNYYCPMDDAEAKQVYQKFERKFATVEAKANVERRDKE